MTMKISTSKGCIVMLGWEFLLLLVRMVLACFML